MTYGSETRPLLVDVGLKFERADDYMDVWGSKRHSLQVVELSQWNQAAV